MHTDQLYQTIEAYLAGKLNPAERAAFEQLVRKDQTVKDYLEAHKTADAALAHSIELDLRAQLTRIDQDLDEKQDRGNFRKKHGTAYKFRVLIAIAASIFIAGSLGLYFWTKNQVSPEKLAQNNLVILNGQTRGERTTDSPFQLMEKAASSFSDKNYNEAAELYQAVLEGDNLLYESAEFNLALVLLAKGDTPNAAKKLEAIARKTDHQYQQEATEILKKLENRG